MRSKPFLINAASRNVFSVCIGLCYGVGYPITVFAQAPTQEEQKLYEANDKRDPFVPLVRDGRFVSGVGSSSATHPSDLLLTGIVWDPAGRSFALIDETEVAVGDTIGGYQVMDIRRDAVVLVRDGKPLMLQMSFEERPEPGE